MLGGGRIALAFMLGSFSDLRGYCKHRGLAGARRLGRQFMISQSVSST
jgi:hypothetical protein